MENIALGLDSRLSSRGLLAQFNKVLDAYRLKLDPRRVVSTLSVGERRRIEIVRALPLNPRLLIMDEPTSVLTPQEVEQLFETLKQLASSGCSILYISHKLHEIVALCDAATILRNGKVVATCDPRRETSRSMAELMIGANLREIAKPAGRVFGAPKLEAQGLTLPKPTEFGIALRDVTLTVRAGEVFGVAGIAGNGQNELLSAMSGETLAPSLRDVLLGGEAVGRLGVTERRNLGLCAGPEERHGHAAVSEFSPPTTLPSPGATGWNSFASASSTQKKRPTTPPKSPAPSPSRRRGRTRSRARFRAATCRSSSWGGRSFSARRRSSSASRPGVSTPAPPPFIRRSSISRRAVRRCWSSRRTSTSS
jgi:ABC-type uncharacterized transport system ATPase subunit